jgi:solute carrier family 45 protein 1/2/4
MACILALAWVEALFGPDPHLTQIMAVLIVVLLNISMTPLAFGLRSLITDLAVAEAQSQVTAWASYSAFAANILSLWAGSLDLPKVLGVASLTQFQALSIISCVSLTTTTTVCLWTAKEQNPKLDVTLAGYKTMGLREVLHSIRQAYGHTPPRIRRVFAIQVFSWTAWFPFLFYMTR